MCQGFTAASLTTRVAFWPNLPVHPHLRSGQHEARQTAAPTHWCRTRHHFQLGPPLWRRDETLPQPPSRRDAALGLLRLRIRVLRVAEDNQVPLRFTPVKVHVARDCSRDPDSSDFARSCAAATARSAGSIPLNPSLVAPGRSCSALAPCPRRENVRLYACGHGDHEGVGRGVEGRLWRRENPIPPFDFGAVAKSSKKIDRRPHLLRRLTLRLQEVCITLKHDGVVGPLNLRWLTTEPRPERLVSLHFLCRRWCNGGCCARADSRLCARRRTTAAATTRGRAAAVRATGVELRRDSMMPPVTFRG